MLRTPPSAFYPPPSWWMTMLPPPSAVSMKPYPLAPLIVPSPLYFALWPATKTQTPA
jgi:hypothetical protein